MQKIFYSAAQLLVALAVGAGCDPVTGAGPDPVRRDVQLLVDSVAPSRRPVPWTARVLGPHGRAEAGVRVYFRIRYLQAGKEIEAGMVADSATSDPGGYARITAALPYTGVAVVRAWTAGETASDQRQLFLRPSLNINIDTTAALDPPPNRVGSLTLTGPTCEDDIGDQYGYRLSPGYRKIFPSVTAPPGQPREGWAWSTITSSDSTVVAVTGLRGTGGTRGSIFREIWGQAPGRARVVAHHAQHGADTLEITVVPADPPTLRVRNVIPHHYGSYQSAGPGTLSLSPGDTATVGAALPCNVALPDSVRPVWRSSDPEVVRIESTRDLTSPQTFTRYVYWSNAQVRAVKRGRAWLTATVRSPHANSVTVSVDVR